MTARGDSVPAPHGASPARLWLRPVNKLIVEQFTRVHDGEASVQAHELQATSCLVLRGLCSSSHPPPLRTRRLWTRPPPLACSGLVVHHLGWLLSPGLWLTPMVEVSPRPLHLLKSETAWN